MAREQKRLYKYTNIFVYNYILKQIYEIIITIMTNSLQAALTKIKNEEDNERSVNTKTG